MICTSIHGKLSPLFVDIEGYPVFVPARSTNQSEYVEVMELLYNSWARAREATGISPPSAKASEEIVADQGSLACLHHLVGYFSEEHTARLNEAAAKAEEEALDLAKAAADRKGVAARTLLDKKLLEEAKAREAVVASETKQITSGDANADQTYNTARAEVALAWLQVAILPPLEELENKKPKHIRMESDDHGRLDGPSTSMSDSFTESYRPASSASTATYAATISSRATSPSSAPSVTSSKGKGKARAFDHSVSLPSAELATSNSNSSKGKGRAL